jgi:hypothetical protein
MTIGSNDSLLAQMTRGVANGTAVMAIQAFPVNALNRISVAACSQNCTAIEATRRIYRGVIDRANPSWIHFQVGLAPYVIKEASRLTFKTAGVSLLKPRLEKHFKNDPHGVLKTSVIFAGTLSCFEVIINPVDTWCTRWQSGRSIKMVYQSLPLISFVKYLYNGAGANGVRQFGQWVGYSVSEDMSNRWLITYTSIDPHSFLGIGLKSWPQSLFLTLPVYPLQRFKTELQSHSGLARKAEIEKRKRYVFVFKHIMKEQGVTGIFRGFFPKVLSNAFLVAGVSILLEQGRKAIKNSSNPQI